MADFRHRDDLLEDPPSHFGGTKTAGEVMSILLDDQIHHGAEIALLRDLYSQRATLHRCPS